MSMCTLRMCTATRNPLATGGAVAVNRSSSAGHTFSAAHRTAWDRAAAMARLCAARWPAVALEMLVACIRAVDAYRTRAAGLSMMRCRQSGGHNRPVRIVIGPWILMMLVTSGWAGCRHLLRRVSVLSVARAETAWRHAFVGPLAAPNVLRHASGCVCASAVGATGCGRRLHTGQCTLWSCRRASNNNGR